MVPAKTETIVAVVVMKVFRDVNRTSSVGVRKGRKIGKHCRQKEQGREHNTNVYWSLSMMKLVFNFGQQKTHRSRRKFAPVRPFSSARFNSYILPSLENSGAVDLDLLDGPVTSSGPDTAKLVNDILALHDLAEDGVLAVKVRSGTESDEELRSVGAGT